MFDVVCTQCKRTSVGAASRLVKDSCGHEKCRMCLLLDEEKCKQCELKSENIHTQPEDNTHSVIKFENHTGVITCNGTAKNPSVAESVPAQNGTNSEMKPPAIKPKGTKSKVKEPHKRPYHSIIIPNHVISEKDPLQYKCTICNKQFSTKSHIKYHAYCTGRTKPFQCKLCLKDFVTKTHLELHQLKHTGRKPFKCLVCQKAFGEKSKLKRHHLLHSTAKPHVCSECGKAFRGKESLKLHTLIHRGEKPYACRVCSMSFNNTSNLNKHLISHSNEKSHMCDECGKTFKLKWALTVHRKSHLRVRPFECSTCSKSFVNSKDLQRHQLIHLGDKAYNCTICTTSFRRKDNLYRHVKNTHPGKKIDPIATTIKQLLKKATSKPVDNPNAINVITASPACKLKADNPNNSRTGTVINGPLKLAFKTSAFKNSYNIHRDSNSDHLTPTVSRPYNLDESMNICHRILSPHSPPPRNVIRKVIEPTSTDICQKILSSPYGPKPLHYETSFESKKHAIIKNIKFKLPPSYTNLKVSDKLCDALPPYKSHERENFNERAYAELKSTPASATSVIVDSNMHWRRRTSQNLCSRLLEN